MKHYILNTILLLFIWVFSNSNSSQLTDSDRQNALKKNTHVTANNPKVVSKSEQFDEVMVSKGSNIFYARCVYCHKLDKEKLVGPGLKGVTNRRSAEWVINTLMHLDKMVGHDLDDMPQYMSDCAIKAQGKNLSKEQAEYVLAFIRSNDAKN